MAGLGAGLRTFGTMLMQQGLQQQDRADRKAEAEEAYKRSIEELRLRYQIEIATRPQQTQEREEVGEDGQRYKVTENWVVDPEKMTGAWQERGRAPMPIEPTKTQRIMRGNQYVQQEFDGTKGQWVDTGDVAPRTTAQTGLMGRSGRPGVYRVGDTNVTGTVNEKGELVPTMYEGQPVTGPAFAPKGKAGGPSYSSLLKEARADVRKYEETDISAALADAGIVDPNPNKVTAAERRKVAGLLADQYATDAGVKIPKRKSEDKPKPDKERPPVEGAQRSPKDGRWYVKKPNGKWAIVE